MRFKKNLILCIVFLSTICLTIFPVSKVVGQNIFQNLTDSCPESEIVNDTYYCKQWNLKNTSGGINWEELKAWETYHNYGRDVIIAILDTGVKWHEDLNVDNFHPGWDYVRNKPIRFASESKDKDGHGSGMAGVAAQKTNNGHGSAGIAYQAKIMPVRIMNGIDEEGRKVDLETIAKGIKFAAENGADVINLSLGEISKPTNMNVGNIVDTKIKILKEAINFANDKGAVVVFAAGNKNPGHKFVGFMHEILKSDKVITVAAHDINGKITDYSGKVANISAPGGSDETVKGVKLPSLHDIFNHGILRMLPTKVGVGNKDYSVSSGSSEASAHVSGVAAIVMSELKSCGNRYETCPKIEDKKIASVARNIIIGSALHSTTNENDIPKLDAAKAELDAWMYIVEFTDSDSYDASAANSKSASASTSFLVPATNLVMQNLQGAEESRADTIILQNQSWIFLFTALIVLISFFLLRRFPFLLGTIVHASACSLVLMSQVQDPILFYLTQALVAFIPVILIILLLQVKYWSYVARGTAFSSTLVLIFLAIFNFGNYQAAYSLLCSILPGTFLVLSFNKKPDEFSALKLEIDLLVKEAQATQKNIEKNLRAFFRNRKK